MEKTKVENQIDQQEKTHGRTTNRISNKDKQQTNNTKLLSPKAGILDQTRRRPRRIDEDVELQ